MSAVRGKAEVLGYPSASPSLAISGPSNLDKAFIGRIERGFDFLGYHFGPEGFTLVAKTIEQFVARAIRLCEQEPGEALASARLGLYVQR